LAGTNRDTFTNPLRERAAALHAYEKKVADDYPRNVWMFFLFELFWGLGLPFAMFSTVVPAYMEELGSSKLLIGLVAPLATILCPLQLAAVHLLRNRVQKYMVAGAFSINKIPWLAYALLLLAFPDCLGHTRRMLFFAAAMVWMAGLGTAFDAPYGAMTVDSIPVKKRGTAAGLRVLALALAIGIGSPIAHWIMTRYPWPRNYHVSFVVGMLFYIGSVVFVLSLREHQNPRTFNVGYRHRTLRRFWPRMRWIFRRLVRDPNYRLFIFFLTLFCIALEFGPFMVVYAKDVLNVTSAWVIWFSVIQLVSGALFTIIMGWVADRIGYKTVGVIQGLLLFAALICVAATTVLPVGKWLLLYGGYTLYSAVLYLNKMVLVNMSAEIMPQQQSSILIAMGNTIMMPMIWITMPLCGWIIDVTHSYLAIFLMGAVLALVSSCGFILFVREPRTHRRYVLRIIRRI